MDNGEIKRKLRKLKHLEIKLRFDGKIQSCSALIWDLFFDLHESSEGKAKYPLKMLSSMAHEEYKNVIGEYLLFLYNELYKEINKQNIKDYDPAVLIELDLPYDADVRTIKRRFHELAKMYHPDTGGDADKFIELMEVYKKLTGKS